MNRRRLLKSIALGPIWWSAKAFAASAGTLATTYGPWPPKGPVRRVYAAGPPAAVLAYCLAPDKMLGWPYALSRAALDMLPSAQRNLPLVGRVAGRGSTIGYEGLMAMRPDLILDVGTVNDTYRSAAEQVASQTGIPYVLMAGDLRESPAQLRAAGRLLEAESRGELLARHAESILESAAQARRQFSRSPTVYLARSADGMETGLAGSIHEQAFTLAGGRNVAHTATSSGAARVSMEQLLAWDPDFIFTQDASFARQARQSPLWTRLRAVKEQRLYLVPMLPFGWVDVPPGINRLLGLRWLIDVFTHGQPSPGIESFAAEFFRAFYRIELPADVLRSALNAHRLP